MTTLPANGAFNGLLPLLGSERHVSTNKNMRSSFEQQIHAFSDGMVGEINRIYRVYCLSTKADSTLMWSHYTNDHQGICLEFACDNIVFGSAIQIQYSREYPLLDFAIDGQDPLGMLPLFVKSDVWSY